jgi:hypothetical protein
MHTQKTQYVHRNTSIKVEKTNTLSVCVFAINIVSMFEHRSLKLYPKVIMCIFFIPIVIFSLQIDFMTFLNGKCFQHYLFNCWQFYWNESQIEFTSASGQDMGYPTGRGPIIVNLHVTREGTGIFRSLFADDNNKWWQSRQQNPTFVSWLIQKKSGKILLETIPLYINLAGRSRKRSGDASRSY